MRAEIVDAGDEARLVDEHEVALPQVCFEDAAENYPALRTGIGIGVPADEGPEAWYRGRSPRRAGCRAALDDRTRPGPRRSPRVTYWSTL